MRRKNTIRQSVAVSALLLAALFLLPLAVMGPFQTELFSKDGADTSTEREPFVSGELDAQTVLKVLNGDQV